MDGPGHTKAEELAGHAESLIEAGHVAALADAAANALGTSGTEARAWADVAGTRFSQG